jgi:hypothetical protein
MRLRCLTCRVEFDAADMATHFLYPHAHVAFARAR